MSDRTVNIIAIILISFMFAMGALGYHEHEPMGIMFIFLSGMMYQEFRVFWEKPPKKVRKRRNKNA